MYSLEIVVTKLSLSQAAKFLGVKRTDLQKKIATHQLHTHEGYLTTTDLRRAYPNFSKYSEQEAHLEKAHDIKQNAMRRARLYKNISKENKQVISTAIKELRQALTLEKAKNFQYKIILSQLLERLDYLEKHCHSKDKSSLNELQIWLREAYTEH